MKKFFTFLMIVAASALVYGQGIIISDEITFADFDGAPEDWGYAIESAIGHSDHGVADNPDTSGDNATDKAYWGVRNEGSWNANVTLVWDAPVLVEGRTHMSIMAYGVDHGTFIYLKIYNEGNVVKEGWASGGTPAASNNTWGQAVIGLAGVTQFEKIEVFLSNNWGGNVADATAYFDELGMYKESYEFQGPFMNMVYEAPYIGDEVIDIDGLDLEDIWIDAPIGEILKINAGDGAGISGQFQAVWDSEFLYMFFLVDDDVVWAWNDADWAFWKGDGFQVYMDVLERRIDDRVFGNLDGFGVLPDLESAGAQEANQGFRNFLNFGDEYKPLAEQGSIITGTGYTIEVKYPWKGLAFGAGGDITDPEAWVESNVKHGLQIAFDAQMNDDDGAGRVNMMSWASEPKEPYANSGTWGAIKLLGDDTSIENNPFENGLKVYPSMANDFINISMQNMTEFRIVDITGRVMHVEAVEGISTRFNTSTLKSGIYFVRAFNGTQNAVQKFVKR